MATGIPHGWMRFKGYLAAILAATGGYRWLLVIIYGWSCYSEYMWLLAAIGGYWHPTWMDGV